MIVNYLLANYYLLTVTNAKTPMLTVMGLIAICLFFYGIFGRNSRVGEMIRYLVLWVANLPVSVVFTYLLASLSFPLIDSELNKIDKALGFDWLNWFNVVNSHSTIKFVLAAAYASMSSQILFSIIYFSHRKEANSCNELWWTATISLVITTIISGFLPAMGAFEHYGVADSLHGVHLPDLHALRKGTITSLPLEHMQGIITLPSYHTVLAIVLTYIYRNQRVILSVVLPLNLVMLVAIPSEGGHYLADMLAGGVVAAFSIWIFAYAAARLGCRSLRDRS